MLVWILSVYMKSFCSTSSTPSMYASLIIYGSASAGHTQWALACRAAEINRGWSMLTAEQTSLTPPTNISSHFKFHAVRHIWLVHIPLRTSLGLVFCLSFLNRTHNSQQGKREGWRRETEGGLRGEREEFRWVWQVKTRWQPRQRETERTVTDLRPRWEQH